MQNTRFITRKLWMFFVSIRIYGQLFCFRCHGQTMCK
jgi:hypothetical protein